MQLTLEQLAKKDNFIMNKLKVNEIRHMLAETNKGNLTLKLEKDGEAKDYRFVLDAVPFSDEDNTELLKAFKGILYKDKSE